MRLSNSKTPVQMPYLRIGNRGVKPCDTMGWEEKALAKVQKELKPGDEKKVVAIALTTGEFVVADDYKTVRLLFRERFPNDGAYIVHADGSPVFRLPWRS